MDMELWYTEELVENVRFSTKVRRHLYSEKSPFQKIDILDTVEFGKILVIDGVIMITEKDEFIYHDMIVHVPMAVNPDIKKVLVIGGGDGGAVRELTRYNTIEKIDMVEIDELVVKASREYLPFTAGELDDSRVTLYFEDGIKFVEDKEDVYDLIIVDSTDPIGPGEGLFTRAFYRNCYKALTENGILINQNESPYYDDIAREMKRVHSKIKEIFPIAKAYQYIIPTYPGSHYIFGFASKKLDPIKDFNPEKWNSLGLETKYYNTELHVGAFALPNYVKEMLEENAEK